MKVFYPVLLFCVSVIFLFASCNKEEDEIAENTPTTKACFTYTVNDSEVSFNSGCSKQASTYLWEFGIGVTSIAKNPTIDFGSAGDFEVTLQISGPHGQDTFEETITIEEICVVCDCVGEWDGGTIGSFCGTSQEVNAWCSSTCYLGADYTCTCD